VLVLYHGRATIRHERESDDMAVPVTVYSNVG